RGPADARVRDPGLRAACAARRPWMSPPPGSAGAPPGSAGAPPGSAGAPPGSAGAPPGSAGAPPGPVLELGVSTQPGGGPQHVLTVATWLQARRWRPIVAAPRDGALFDRFRASGIEIVELATHRFHPATLARLFRLVRQRGVRLIHSHGKGAGLY